MSSPENNEDNISTVSSSESLWNKYTQSRSEKKVNLRTPSARSFSGSPLRYQVSPDTIMKSNEDNSFIRKGFIRIRN